MTAIRNFFAKLLAWIGTGQAERDLNSALGLVPKALPIVRAIAEATPTRADDEILAAYERWGIPISQDLLKAEGLDKGMLLFNLASNVLAMMAPSVPIRIIQLAVQAAYAGWRAGAKVS